MERPVVQRLEPTAGWPETIKGLGVAPLPSNDTEGLPQQSHAPPTSLADSKNSYQYQDLNGVDEFRLLIISPGSFDDALHGEAITTNFSGPTGQGTKRFRTRGLTRRAMTRDRVSFSAARITVLFGLRRIARLQYGVFVFQTRRGGYGLTPSVLINQVRPNALTRFV